MKTSVALQDALYRMATEHIMTVRGGRKVCRRCGSESDTGLCVPGRPADQGERK
jgi:hypothetical protein